MSKLTVEEKSAPACYVRRKYPKAQSIGSQGEERLDGTQVSRDSRTETSPPSGCRSSLSSQIADEWTDVELCEHQELAELTDRHEFFFRSEREGDLLEIFWREF